MKKRIQKISQHIFLAVFMAISVIATAAVPAQAINVLDRACQQSGGTEVCQAQGDSLFGSGGIWTNIINMLLFLAGAVAVIMIVIAGIKYTISNGDQAQITSAKNTIIYSIVGLVLAIMAGAIVNFVLNGF